MTYPSANPAGEHEWLVRNALKNWVDAQDIYGVVEIYLSLRPSVDWDLVEMTGEGHATLIYINIARSNEARQANTGPDNPGGKEILYSAELRVLHHGMSVDGWDDAARDYARVCDRLKDCLRAQGRDLGRPDVILMVGDWPGEIVVMHSDPSFDEEAGTVERIGQINFDIYQYLPTFVPSAPV